MSANAINKDVGVHTKVSLNVRHRVASPAPDPKDVLHEDDQSILVTGSLVLPQLSVGGQPLTGLRARV